MARANGGRRTRTAHYNVIIIVVVIVVIVRQSSGQTTPGFLELLRLLFVEISAELTDSRTGKDAEYVALMCIKLRRRRANENVDVLSQEGSDAGQTEV